MRVGLPGAGGLYFAESNLFCRLSSGGGQDLTTGYCVIVQQTQSASVVVTVRKLIASPMTISPA